MESFMNKFGTAVLATACIMASQSLYAQARVAVAHFAPFADTLEATAVDVVVNDATILEGVEFKAFTDF